MSTDKLVKRLDKLLSKASSDSFLSVTMEQQRLINVSEQRKDLYSALFVYRSPFEFKNVSAATSGFSFSLLRDNVKIYGILESSYDEEQIWRIRYFHSIGVFNKHKFKIIYGVLSNDHNESIVVDERFTILMGSQLYEFILGDNHSKIVAEFKTMLTSYVYNNYLVKPVEQKPIAVDTPVYDMDFPFNKSVVASVKIVDSEKLRMSQCINSNLFNPYIPSERYSTFHHRYTLAQRYFMALEQPSREITFPLTLKSPIDPAMTVIGTAGMAVSVNNIIMTKKRYDFLLEQPTTVSSWEELGALVRQEIEEHGDGIDKIGGIRLIKNMSYTNTLNCDVVVDITDSCIITLKGLRIFHHHRFCLDLFPSDYHNDMQKYRYTEPLYYRGRIYYMHRTTAEKLEYPIDHVFKDDAVADAFSHIVNVCTRQIVTENNDSTFSQFLRGIAVLEKSDYFYDKEHVSYYIDAVAAMYNPQYVFGFDKNAPHTNYGFDNPYFFVPFIEYEKYTIPPFHGQASTVEDDRMFAAYLLRLTSIIKHKFQYKPSFDK